MYRVPSTALLFVRVNDWVADAPKVSWQDEGEGRPRYMTKDEIAVALYEMNKKFVNPRWILRGLSSKIDYKRDMYIWFAKVSALMAVDAVKRRINPFQVEHYQQLVKPHWYDG